MSKGIKAEIESLREELRRHEYLYYVLSQPQISDKEYDDLMQRLLALEQAHPRYSSPDSPTQRVGGGILEGFAAVTHRQKMYSLDNTYSADDLAAWHARVLKGLPGEQVEFVAELKIDGLSANLTYAQGKFLTGVTRGDGEKGEDVSANVRTIRPVPLVLRGKALPSLVEVRGEVYLSKKEFRRINAQREAEGEDLFANPRNAAAGSLKLLDTGMVSRRKLLFFGHSLGACEGAMPATQWEFLASLKEWGVPVNPYSALCRDFGEVAAFCRSWQEKRDSLEYEIDGIVVKVNSLRQQEKLGVTMKSPRWAVAYKFPAHQATTEVLGITVNVGRTGVITPRAEFAPVECGGVVIRHATLHNFDEIRRLGVKPGDRVLIERAGDVIPKVVKVVKSGTGKEVLPPEKCPACLGQVVKEKEEDVAYRCINPSCPAQLERGLLHFASRQAMDIEGMGESVVSQLVSLRMVRTVADIYGLKARDLERLELFKEKKVSNLLGAIEASKKRTLSRLVFALGIRNVGEKAAYTLAQRFHTMGQMMHASFDEIDGIPEIGGVMAHSLVQYFSLPQTRQLIAALSAAGVCMEEAARGQASGPLQGKKVVFTGTLAGFSRSRAEEMLRERGGEPVSSVSSHTDYVVAGSDPGSKLNAAKKLGVRVINEEEFTRLLEVQG